MIKTSKILSILLLLIVASASWASPKGDLWDPSEGKWSGKLGDFYYYITDDGKAIITNSNHSETGSTNGGGAYEYGISIPSTVTYEGETFPVVAIQDFAFYNCPNLTEVNIPSSITEIGKEVFRKCPNLARINVENSSGHFRSVNGILYDKWSTELIAVPAKVNIEEVNYVLPTTVTSIRDYAMAGCTELTTVTLPTGLKKIGKNAFEGCTSLISVNIPSGLTKIGEYAFNNCGKLAIDVVIPEAIQEIPQALFQNCSSIKSVTLHPEVYSIGWQAFFGCAALMSIQLPNDIETIATGAFANTGLTSIEIPANLSTISSSAFSGTKLSNVVLHEGLTTIEEYAFNGIGSTLASINIPKSVRTISNYAFNGTFISDIYINNIPSKISLSKNAPFAKPTDLKIHVFTQLADEFKNATGWSKYADYIVDDIDIKHVTAITLDKYQITIPTSSTGYLTAMISPNDAEIKDVLFTTEENGIVTITNASTGKFSTGSKEGETTITCKALDGSGITVTCSVIVVNNFINATGVTIAGESSAMEVDATRQLSAEVAPSNATLKNILWASTNKDVATVSDDGKVTAVGIGSTTIIALSGDGNARAEFEINVGYNTYVVADNGDNYTNNVEAHVKTLTYNRTFGTTNYQALYVPFSMSYNDWKNDFDIYKIVNFHTYDTTGDGINNYKELEIEMVKSGTLRPNHPYIIKAKTTGAKSIIVRDATLYANEENSIECSSVEEAYKFTGTYSNINGLLDKGASVISGGAVQSITSNTTTLAPYRWYVQITDREGQVINTIANAKIVVIGEYEDETTGIDEITSASNDNAEAIYSTNGVKVKELQKGLNIVKMANGSTKKIIVR